MKENTKLAINVSLLSIIVNTLLAVFKFIAGIVALSHAMVSDAVHTLSDILSTLVVIAGIKLSSKEADEKHQFGHERFECVAAVILSVMLALAGVYIGYDGVIKLLPENSANLPQPGLLALIAAAVSILVKEWMYHYTRRTAKKINSGAMLADAWHHRSDALSSVGSLLGIIGARLGLAVLDPIASIVICLLIIKAAVDIFMNSVGKMTDKACDAEIESKMREAILRQQGVMGIDQLKTRLFGDMIYVEVEVSLSGEETFANAHKIAHIIHDAIENEFPNVKHCTVHVNPV